MLLPEVMLLKEMNIVVIPVGIGSEVDVTEQELMPNVGDIINTSAAWPYVRHVGISKQ